MERIDIILEYIYKTNLVVNRMMQLDGCMLQEVYICILYISHFHIFTDIKISFKL